MSFHVGLTDVSVRIVDGTLKCTCNAYFPYYLDPVKISIEKETDLDNGFEMDIRNISSELLLFIPMVVRYEYEDEHDDAQLLQICVLLQNEINYELYKVHLQEAIIEEIAKWSVL